MTKKIQQRSIATQDRILAVARELFDDLGQANVTTDMIAAKANVAKGTVFAHFMDRANLIAAVGIQDLDAVLEQIDRTPSDVPAIDRIMTAYQTFLTMLADKPEFARLFVQQSFHTTGKWSERFNHNCQDFELILRDIILQSRPPADADFLVGGAQAFFLQIVTYQQAGWLDDEQAITQLRAYLTRWLA